MLRARRRVQDTEQDDRILQQVKDILDKPNPKPTFNPYRDLFQFQNGGREVQRFKDNIYSSISLVQRYSYCCALRECTNRLTEGETTKHISSSQFYFSQTSSNRQPSTNAQTTVRSD